MTDYGTILNPNLAPEKLAIYNLFNSYFSDPILTKIKNENGGSMYAAKQNLLMREVLPTAASPTVTRVTMWGEAT